MGMFQPQNYGADFVNAMTATSGMLNDRRKLDMESQRQTKEDETRNLQNTVARQSIESNNIDMEKKRNDRALEQQFSKLFEINQRKRANPNYQYTDDDVKVAGQVLGLTPGVPNDPAQFPAALQNMNTVLSASEQIRNVPPGFHIIQRGENPQYDAVFDAQQSLLSSNHLGQEHTDADGSVTGKPGTVYKTAGIGGSGIFSGEGNKAAFVPLYSITYADGTPIIDQTTGKPKLVPRTEDRSNNPNAKLSPLTPENLQMMVGARVAQMKAIDDIVAADPKNRDKIMEAALQASMGTEEKKKLAQEQIKTSAAAKALRDQLEGMPEGLQKQQVQTAVKMLESGNASSIKEALELSKVGKPDKTTLVLKEGDRAVALGTDGKTTELASNPKVEKTQPHNMFSGASKGADLIRQFPQAKDLNPNAYYHVTQVGDKMYFAEDRPPKAAADPAVAESKRAERESKTAIDKASEELTRAKKQLAVLAKDGKAPGDADYDTAAQELSDAKTAYLNRTAEHKSSYGREYSPIKEVVERKAARDITPLSNEFKANVGILSRHDYPTLIRSAESKGWTPDEIKRAAAGTKGADDVASYYATKGSSQPAAQQPTQRGMAPAKQVTPAKKSAKPTQTASAGGYVYQNGKLVRR